MSWRNNPDRHCADTETVLFFPPVRRTHVRSKQEAKARAVCEGCPVVAECLAYALDNREPGVWGNTTEDERRTILRIQKEKQAC